MGISLSNHEDRIKKLEEIKTVGFKSVKIFDKWKLLQDRLETLVTLSETPDLLWIETSFGGPNNTLFFDTALIPFSTMIDNVLYILNSSNKESNPSVIYAKYLSASRELQFGIKNSLHNDDGIRTIYGLKLYYSFSYNIIYKILLRKISRLGSVLHFNLFEISSRRGGVKYGN